MVYRKLIYTEEHTEAKARPRGARVHNSRGSKNRLGPQSFRREGRDHYHRRQKPKSGKNGCVSGQTAEAGSHQPIVLDPFLPFLQTVCLSGINHATVRSVAFGPEPLLLPQ